MVFEKMNIDTLEVIEAMNTKWNALGFVPGLVGGHCIGVDPYYFIYKAQRLGYQSQIIAPARQINDGMPQFIVNQLIKHLILQDTKVKGAKVAILGFTFKENAVDIRNSKVFDMIPHLNEVGITPVLYDPLVKETPQNIHGHYHIATLEEIHDCDALILAVGHSRFKSWSAQEIKALLKEEATLVYDVKGIYPKSEFEKAGLTILRL
jgi:UDP-N-acetyl-D-glucosamine/UDP-N-acetyl-D-galactosamine dehydrogenase